MSDIALFKMIDDINTAWYSGAYYSALTSVLTIPDICGGIKYPNYTIRRRYMQWFADKKYNKIKLIIPESYNIDRLTSSEINLINNYKECHDEVYALYKLRCSLLHSGYDSYPFKKSESNILLSTDMEVTLNFKDDSYTSFGRFSFGKASQECGMEQEDYVKYDINIRWLHKNMLKWLEEDYFTNPTQFVSLDNIFK